MVWVWIGGAWSCLRVDLLEQELWKGGKWSHSSVQWTISLENLRYQTLLRKKYWFGYCALYLNPPGDPSHLKHHGDISICRWLILVLFNNAPVLYQYFKEGNKHSWSKWWKRMSSSEQTYCLIVQDKAVPKISFSSFSFLNLKIICFSFLHDKRKFVSPHWTLSNVLHCPRTLGSNFQKKSWAH